MVSDIRDRVSVDQDTAAEILGISLSRLRQHVRLGDLVPHYTGSKPLYLITELERFVVALPTHPEHLPTL